MKKAFLFACASLLYGSGVMAQTNYENLADNFKLVANGTAGTEITIATKTQVYSYTPTTTGEVTFSRYKGLVAVYEGEDFKGYISADENPTTFATPVADADGSVSNSLLENGSFYNDGGLAGGSNYYFGEPWVTNVTVGASGGIRVEKADNQGYVDGVGLIWRGTKNSNYFAQPITGKIKPNTQYKIFISQTAASNANATFYVGLGSEASNMNYAKSDVKLGTGCNGIKEIAVATTNEVANVVYFTLQNSSTNTASSGTDPMPRIDYVALVEGTPSVTPGLSGAAEVSYAANDAQLPSTVWNGDFESCNSFDIAVAEDANGGWNDDTYVKDMFLPAGWNALKKSNSGMGVFTYGSEVKMNSANIPDREGVAEGDKALGICAAWDGYVYAYQYVYLSAGSYKLTYDIAAATTLGGTNTTGVYVNGTNIANNVTLPAVLNEWETQEYTINIAADCEAEVRLSYAAASGGSGSQARLFFDNVKLEKLNTLDKSELLDAIAEAKEMTETSSLNAAIAAAEALAESVSTVAELNEAVAALRKAMAIAEKEATVLGASAAEGKAFNFVVNGTFDSNINGWTSTTGAQNNKLKEGQTGAFTGNIYENWNPSAFAGKMYQVIENVPNGTYCLSIAAFANTLGEGVHVYANNDKVALTTTEGYAYKVWTVVTSNQLEIGLEQETAVANWMGIDNVSLTYYGAGKVIADAIDAAVLNEDVPAAQAVLDDEAYANVTGAEKTALETAIANTTGLAELEALNAAVATFKSAKDAYDGYVAAKSYAETFKLEDYPYASVTKYAAIASACTATPASATVAATATGNVQNAYRTFVESNAMAEGIEGAVNMSSKIADADFEEVTISGNSAGAWRFTQQTPGILGGEPYTDGDGVSEHKYFDLWRSPNSNRLSQDIIGLPAGKYIMTVTARADASFNGNIVAFAGDSRTPVPAKGNSGEVFNRGWNDVTVEFVHNGGNVAIGVQSMNDKVGWWGATRFRLVKIADVEASVDYAFAAEYGTIILPFNAEKPAGMEVYSCEEAESNGTTLALVAQESIKANTPYIVKKTGETSEFSFSGISVRENDSYAEGWLTGVYASTAAPVGSYVLQNHDGVVGFYEVAETKPTVGANRAYLTVPAEAAAVKAFYFDKATGINAVEGVEKSDAIYDLSGRRVSNAVKGIYIINGKKVLK